MDQKKNKYSLPILLFSGFIDYAGVAIVYPLLAYILFEPSFNFLDAQTSGYVRGIWLGVLIAIYPFCQFIFAPIFGKISDLKGRKKLLRLTFALSLVGYAVAYAACLYQNIILFACYRLLAGIAAGNCSIISAIIADLSTPETKAKNYGFLSMSFGAGFTFGPFLSGLLVHSVSLSAPFFFAFWLVLFNLILISWKLQETNPVSKKGKVGIFSAIEQIVQAAKMPELRFTFLCLFIFSFGWSLFTEFVSLFLIDRFQFTPASIGFYYGYTGLFYALSAGFLIYPLIRLLKLERALYLAMLFSGISLLVLSVIKNQALMWMFLPIFMFFLAFVYPSICAIISNRVSAKRQGGVMGVYQAIIALALAITPFFSSFFVGSYPVFIVIGSGVLMLLASVIYAGLRDKVPTFDPD